MTDEAINQAIKFLKDRNYSIPIDLLKALSNDYSYELTNDDRLEFVKSIKAEMKQAGDYQSIRNTLWAAIYDKVYDYLNSNSKVDTYKSPLVASVSQAYIETADIAYVDGGGSLPMDEDTASLARSYLNSQLSYVDSMFEALKQMRKDGDFDAIHTAFLKADLWASSLDGYYNMVKLSGAGNKMLTFTHVRNTKESCDDCKMLRGKRHRASWWISHEYVPPKGTGLACSAGGHCGDVLMTDDGEEFTV